MESSSADSVASLLLNSGVTPIDIAEIEKQPEKGWGGVRQRLFTRKPGIEELVLFCRQMYSITRAGVPIIRGITGLAETTRNPVLAEALFGVRNELESGRELSMAMGRYGEIFSPIMVSMVRVGETTGRLEEAFLQLAQYLELERDTRSRVKAALRYPSFVVLAIVAAVVVVNIWVIPKFADAFERMKLELPWQTHLLINVSDFFVNYWPLMLIGAGVALFGVRFYVRTSEGRYRWDRLKLRLPLVGSIIHRATLARFSRSFAMSIASGVPLVQALTVVSRAVDNEYVGSRVLNMRNGVERGESLTRTATASNLFTPLVLQMLAVGEESGAVDRMLAEVADFYEREVDYDLKNLSTAIEPILIVAIGILVLILALGIFLPMWDLTKLAHR
jgi:MSHA biogenesis protein MshG